MRDPSPFKVTVVTLGTLTLLVSLILATLLFLETRPNRGKNRVFKVNDERSIAFREHGYSNRTYQISDGAKIVSFGQLTNINTFVDHSWEAYWLLLADEEAEIAGVWTASGGWELKSYDWDNRQQKTDWKRLLLSTTLQVAYDFQSGDSFPLHPQSKEGLLSGLLEASKTNPSLASQIDEMLTFVGSIEFYGVAPSADELSGLTVFPQLKMVSFIECEVSAEMLQGLQNLPLLERISLEYDEPDQDAWQAFKHLANVAHIVISPYYFEGLSAEGKKTIGQLKRNSQVTLRDPD